MRAPSIHRLAAIACAAALMSGGAQAAWTFNTSASSGLYDAASGATITSLSAFAASNSGGSGYSNSGTVTGNWGATTLTHWSGGGFGAGGESGSPDHGVDNRGNTEGILVRFDKNVVLTSVGLGYAKEYSSGTNSNPSFADQADLSIFRWTGNSAPTLAGTSAPNMTSGGWELVTNYFNMGVDTSDPFKQVNTTGKTSSWWLISAYNAGFGTAAQSLGSGGADVRTDFFKLYGLAGTVCANDLDGSGKCNTGGGGQVSEPGALALAGLGLFGAALSWRRRRQIQR